MSPPTVILTRSISFLLVVVTKKITICDFSVFGYVCEFYKETCVCVCNVANAFKKSACLVARTSFPQGLKIWVICKGHVLHLRARDCMHK
jgi:hypothetical protein